VGEKGGGTKLSHIVRRTSPSIILAVFMSVSFEVEREGKGKKGKEIGNSGGRRYNLPTPSLDPPSVYSITLCSFTDINYVFIEGGGGKKKGEGSNQRKYWPKLLCRGLLDNLVTRYKSKSVVGKKKKGGKGEGGGRKCTYQILKGHITEAFVSSFDLDAVISRKEKGKKKKEEGIRV